MRTVWYVIGWALLFSVFAAFGTYLVGALAGLEGETSGLPWLIAPFAGGAYGWHRSRRARAVAEGPPRRKSPSAERIGAFIAVTLVTLPVLLVGAFIFVGMATNGGECSFEEVECGQVREFIATDAFAAVLLALIVAAALVIAWGLVLSRRPNNRGRFDRGRRTYGTGDR